MTTTNGSPWVNFKMTPTQDVSSTPTIIFGNDVHTCLLDGVVLANISDTIILVTLSIAREVTVGTETDFILGDQIPLQPHDRVDVLCNTTLTLEAGDLLYASSDDASHLFNTFVSYRELTEL